MPPKKDESVEPAAIVPLEDRFLSPRFQRAMGIVGVVDDDLRPMEPPVVEDPDSLEEKAGMVRYELREKRRQRDLTKVLDARRQMVIQAEGGSPSAYVPGRFRTAQPSTIALGLSRSLPGYDNFKLESKGRKEWARGLHFANVQHKKEMIARAAVTDVQWQKFQKDAREHETMLLTRLDKFREGEAKKQRERVKEGEKKLEESQRRIAKVAAEWEEEGQRRVEVFDEKCRISEERVANRKADLFSRSCDRDEKILECLARRKDNLDQFIDKTLGSYYKMEEHLAATLAKKEELFLASLREAGNKAELAALERAEIAARKEERSREVGQKVSDRMEHLHEYLEKRQKGWKDNRKERELAWNKQYGRVKKNVVEMQEEFEKKREKVYERQRRVFAQGEEGLAKKKIFAGTRKEIEDAYRDSVRTNQERQEAAEAYNRQVCCDFWKQREQQFRDVDRFKNQARTQLQKTKKLEIHINNEMREVVGDIKSFGYRDARHDKMLKAHGLNSDKLLRAPPKAEEDDGKK